MKHFGLVRATLTGVLTGGLAGAALLAATPATALPVLSEATPISGALHLIAVTNLNPASPLDTTADVTDAASQGWTTTPTALSASVHSSSSLGSDTVDASEAVSATWTSANAGTVTFTQSGWTFSASQNYSAAQLGVADVTDPGGAGPTNDWSYTFTATANGAFTVDYATIGSGFQFGLRPWAITCSSCAFASRPSYTDFDVTTAGSFSTPLSAGVTYTVGFENGSNVYNGTPGMPLTHHAFYTGNITGTYSWAITETAVPEPATWALLLAGFGGVGAMARRRRAVAARPGSIPPQDCRLVALPMR